MSERVEKYNDKAIFKHQYVHVVYFWFKESITKDDKTFFDKSLRKFLKNSQYAKTQFIGVATQAAREVVYDSFTY